MKTMARRMALFAAPLLFLATHAMAELERQVVWKLVDKKGRITYVDSAPPKDYEGKVTRIEIDLTVNRATLTNIGESSPPRLLPLTAPELKRVKADAELARARDRLSEARKALADGKEPTPEETQWLGNVGGGARLVPTDAYHARIKTLEDAVKAATAEVDRAQKVARQAAID